MKVRSGWNSDYAKKKYDVELDEADLERLLRQAKFDMLWARHLTVSEAHTLLYETAEIIAKTELARFDPSMREVLARQVAGHKAVRKDAFVAIRERLSGERGD